MEMLNSNESVVFVYGKKIFIYTLLNHNQGQQTNMLNTYKGYSYWFEEIDNKYM